MGEYKKQVAVQMRRVTEPQAVVAAERLEGADIYSKFSTEAGQLELAERDLTVHVGGACYPCLRLRSVQRFNAYGGYFLRMIFRRSRTPWSVPLQFYCELHGESSSGLALQRAEAITIGYPVYPPAKCRWELVNEPAVTVS